MPIFSVFVVAANPDSKPIKIEAEAVVTVGRRSPMSRVNELLDEKVRLGNLDAMGVLDTNEFKKRMFQLRQVQLQFLFPIL